VNKYILVGLLAVPAIVFILQSLDSANAEVGSPTPPNSPITAYVDSDTFYHVVHVLYESNSTLVMYGDLVADYGGHQEPNTDLWKAMDSVKQRYGYHLQEVMTSGQGSVANPTTIYLLMTK
jgi:hypothetical protein